MREKLLYALWGGMYILCVGLGFVKEPVGLGKALLVLVAVLFFVPGAILLYDGLRAQNRKALRRLRIVCVCSLGLTLALLIANFFSVLSSAAVGAALYELLVLVSAPMVCAQYWLVSLFLWACLLVGSFLRKKEIS